MLVPITTSIGAGFGSGIIAKITRRDNAYSAQVITFAGIYSSASGRDPELEPLIAKALATRSPAEAEIGAAGSPRAGKFLHCTRARSVPLQ